MEHDTNNHIDSDNSLNTNPSMKIVKRGVEESDCKWFSPAALSILKKAQEEIEWFLNRDYKIGPVVDFIGAHYQLSARQRLALLRSTASSLQCKLRGSKLLPCSALKDGPIYIDGFNLIISLEVALSGGIILIGNDGALRDMAGLRGTYHIIDKTYKAIELIGKVLHELKVPQAVLFLDAPVSNSGKLKSLLLESSKNWNFPLEVELVPNPDTLLSTMSRIVTSDSVILDECISWINLSKIIIEDYIKEVNLINLQYNEKAHL